MFVFTRHKSLLARITGIMLMAVISITIGNRILFTHVHELADGTYVVHAHPFSTDEGKQTQKEQHTHSNAALYFILALDTLMVLSFILPLIFSALGQKIRMVLQTGNLQPVKVLTSSGRAPPRMR